MVVRWSKRNMRTFGAIVLGFFFLLAFNAGFIVHAVGGYPLDAASVTDTMRTAQMYERVMEGLDLAVVESIKSSSQPMMATVVASGLEDALEESMTQAWFYETVESAYGGFVAYLEGTDEVGEVDLSEPKQRLREYLGQVADTYGAGDPSAKAELQAALDVIPNRITVAELIEKGGGMNRAELEQAREAIFAFNVIRSVLFVIAFVLLGLIALVAKETPKRLLISVGAVLLLSGLFYLGAASVTGDAVWTEIESELNESKTGDPIDDFANETVNELVEVGVSDAFARSNLAVGGLTGLGLLLFGAGFVVGRK